MTWRKPVLAILLAGAILGGNTGLAGFSDTAGHWAEAAIEKWDPVGIVIGDSGIFRPDEAITRGEVAVLLDQVMEYPQAGEADFADLGEDFYSAPLSRVAAQGVLQGSNGLVRPLDPLTRQEMAVVLARAFGIAGEGTPSFGDAGSIADWASGAVAALQRMGVIQGSGGFFDPTASTTRAQMIQMLENMVATVYNGAAIEAAGMVIEGTTHSGNVMITGNGVLKNVSIDGNLILSAAIGDGVILHDVDITGRVINLGQAQVIQSGTTTVTVEKSPVSVGMEEGYTPPVRETIDYFGREIAVQQGVPLSTLNPQNFFIENSLPAYVDSQGRRAVLGIDVSAWQQEIDWAAVKAAGINFAMLRVGGRGYNSGLIYEDIWFEENVKGAVENGIDVGVYFFSQAVTVTEALEEAEFVLNAIEGHTISYPITFDWEWIGTDKARTDKVTGETATACAKVFCQAIEEAGYRAAVYLYTETVLMLFDLEQLAAYEFWFALYKDRPDFYYKLNMWQFTSSGTVPGVAGKCDMNLYFK